VATAPRQEPWRTIPEILLRCVAHRPEVVVLSDGVRPDLTASALAGLVRSGAARLAGAGVARGHYVVVDTTSLSWSEAVTGYLAVTWLGAGAVLTMGEPTLQVARERLGPRVAVSGAAGGILGLRTFTPADLATAAGPADLASAAGPAVEPQAAPEDDLDVVFTSGTTGTPKPVVSRHSQWTGSVRPEVLSGGRQRVVAHSGVPVGVSGGLHGVVVNHLARGVTSLAAPTAADLVERCRARYPARPVDELHVTPHAARGAVRLTDPGEAWAGAVGTIRVVGGPLPRALADTLVERFPRARIVSIYGLTEGGAALCVRVVGRGASDSVGRPAAGTEVVALDERGRPLPPGEVGELAVRPTGTTPLAYLADVSLNRDRFTDGWARTGDLGLVDDAGEVHLSGRVKELLFLRGGRLPPEFVEDILARQVPDGVDFAVTGLPTPGGWDRIAVFLAGDEADPDVALARARLAALKGPFRPHLVHLLEEIPRTPNGKPLRRVLTEALGALPGPPGRADGAATAELRRLNSEPR
jgi:acyl-coenzyme A synthetase/AMP-(fatty) acid ligase